MGMTEKSGNDPSETKFHRVGKKGVGMIEVCTRMIEDRERR